MKRFYSLLLCVCLLAVMAPAQAISVLIKSGLGTNVTPLPFLLVLASDGNTPITGKTSATITVTVYKPGGSGFVAAGGTITEKGNGVYEYLPSATETASNGVLYVHIADTTDAAQAQDYSGQVVGFDPNTDLGAATLATVNTLAASTNARVLLALPGSAAGLAGGLPKLTAFGRNDVNLKTVTTPTGSNAADGTNNGDGTTTSTLGGLFAFPNATLGTYSGTPPTAAQIAAAILANPANLLQTDNSGYAKSNLQAIAGQAATAAAPVSFPASVGNSTYTGLTAPQLALLGGSWYAAPTNADTSGVTTLLSRLPSALTFSGGNVNSAAQNLPTDYQQRGNAVTLPVTAPAGYGGGTGSVFDPFAQAIPGTPYASGTWGYYFQNPLGLPTTVVNSLFGTDRFQAIEAAETGTYTRNVSTGVVTFTLMNGKHFNATISVDGAGKITGRAVTAPN